MQSSLLGQVRLRRCFFLLMLVFRLASFAVISATAQYKPKPEGTPVITIHNTRSSASDLEIGGDLVASPPGTTSYLTREGLLALPQVSYTVEDDANFKGPTQVSGVPLELLATYLSAAPKSDMVIALCSDHYHANYPRAYISAHHPLLVLKVNGQPPSAWPKNSEGHNFYKGPYLVSQPKFVPSFSILSHSDEPQFPWGVVRIEFRSESEVFNAIVPLGPHAQDQQVQDGFRIAKQNCFRCHNFGSEGGQQAGRPWQVLAVWANASPEYFTAYIRNPKGKNPKAKMPGNPNYDDATILALLSYFRTAPTQEKP